MPSRDPLRLPVAAVLFDMDGTLVDSTAVVEAAWGSFAAEHGIDHGELLAFSHGRQALETVRRFAPGHPDPEGVVRELQAGELELADATEPIGGARELIDALAVASVPTALVTSAPRALAEARMRGAGLPLPPVVLPSEDVERSKPDPEGYLTAARLLGVSADACVVFEDAGAGLAAARATGATPIVVGGFAGSEADGLARVPDLAGIHVERDAGTAVLVLPPR